MFRQTEVEKETKRLRTHLEEKEETENRGLILYRGTICGLTEKTPFLYRYFKVLGQKISC